ncbi:MAG: outer membrane protein assembly factor BamA [Thermodesulfobacteriota bacterium]|nr:outer membrane protein assembly factor BamA [Thermodesulfobacteriota bacterium]
MIFRRREGLFVIAILLVFLPVSVFSATHSSIEKENVEKVAFLPFEIHSSENVLLLQDQIADRLTTELMKSGHIKIIKKETFEGLIEGKKVDDRLAVAVGENTGANFAIVGSLTKLGDMLSADVGVINVKSGHRWNIFAQGNNMDDLASRLKNDILLKILTGQRIVEIKFTGNLRIEDDAIYNVLKSTKGKLLSRQRLSSDIKAIYKMGYFKDVAVKVTTTREGKVINFMLEEMPLVTSVDIEGNDDIEKEDIEGVISVKEKQLLNLNKLKADIENIKTLYKNEGHLNAEVKYSTYENKKGVRVVFNIIENKELYVKKITFEGNRAYTDEELSDLMETSEWSMFHFITDSGVFNEDKLKQDTNRLTVFYLNSGYINAKIGEPEITHDREWIYVKISVIEGKQFRVGNVRITGDSLTIPRSELMSQLQITEKDYFDREAIIKDIDKLTEVCSKEGYAYANIIPRTVPRDDEQKIDITYNIDKGDLVYINTISITGNTTTRDKVIRRQLAVVEKDLYDSSKLKTSYMKLNRLRYFEEVNFQTGKGTDESLMDIDVHVRERSTGMFSVGAGYSATDKLVFMTQISEQNLFGRGQTLGLSAYFGSTKTSYELSFVEPWLFDIPLWSKFEIWNTDREYDSYDLQTKGFGTTLGYPLFEYVIGYVGYRLALDNVINVESTASDNIKDQEGKTTSSGVTLSLSRNTTDDMIFPSKGSKNRISAEVVGTIFQGDVSFAKYIADSKWFFPMPLDTVFGIHGRIGYIQELEGKEIPVFERFYLGGINSLRGLREVGPVDPDTGDPIGGATMLNFNAEVVFPLIKDAGVRGVIFFDTGNAWTSGYYLDDMRRTAGAGVRWYSPIGPLRLEWGYVLDRQDFEPQSRWEFTIGMFM